MAQGDTDVRVVEDPTATNIKAAVDAAITATSASAAVSITQLGAGKQVLIVTVEGA